MNDRKIIIQRKINSAYYNKLVEELINLMRQGDIFWRQPWFSVVPRNYKTDRKYNGINIVNLNYSAFKKEFKSNYWITEKQAKSLKGDIKEEEVENFTNVIMAKWVPKSWINKYSKKTTVYWLLIRVYPVYNLDQTIGVKKKKEDEITLFENSKFKIKKAENIINNFKEKPTINIDNHAAYYSPSEDKICIPQPQNFISPEEYYCTLFHELIHSTGHPQRLKRHSFMEKVKFGDEKYAKEEIVAELGAAFLCAECGFIYKTMKNSAAYLQSWLRGLENDYTLMFRSTSNAQNAVNYILGKEVLNENEEPTLFDEITDESIWERSKGQNWE